MNCEHFQERMQIRLDDRLALEDDQELVQHANGCHACDAHLHAWRSIESVIGLAAVVDVDKESWSTKAWSLASVFPKFAAVAASGLIGFGLVAWNQSESNAPVSSASQVATVVPMEAIDVDSALQAARWLETIRPNDWLAQTMPTVRNVRQGVAPLRKSLMQAVTILTAGQLDSIESVRRTDSVGTVGESSQTS